MSNLSNPHLILRSDGWYVFDMPEKPTTCTQKNITCNDCYDRCGLYEFKLRDYDPLIQNAIDNAVKIEQDIVSEFSSSFFKVNEHAVYQIPKGYHTEIEDKIAKLIKI